MPIIEEKYSLESAECVVVYLGKQTSVPEFMYDFVTGLVNNISLELAGHNRCGEKAERLARYVQDNELATDAGKVVMTKWLDISQPDTPYKSIGATTGSSYHALAYFEKNTLFFACDLNICPYRGVRTPFFPVFVCDDQRGLLELLNAVYANKDAHLLPIGTEWFSAVGVPPLIEFEKVQELGMLAQKYEMTTDRHIKGFFKESIAITTSGSQSGPQGALLRNPSQCILS